jgi:hypothetical protein
MLQATVLAFASTTCKLGLEGAISKLADRPYVPGNRGIWVKSKCLNREEFVVVGWTDPEGSRSHFGALLLGYYTADGRLHYAGRAGTGINDKELKRLAGVLKRLAVPKMPLAEPPPRDSRFGSPFVPGAAGGQAGEEGGAAFPEPAAAPSLRAAERKRRPAWVPGGASASTTAVAVSWGRGRSNNRTIAPGKSYLTRRDKAGGAFQEGTSANALQAWQKLIRWACFVF